MATVVVNFEGNADALLDALRGVGTESERTAEKIDKVDDAQKKADKSAKKAGSSWTKSAIAAGKVAVALQAAGAAAGVFLQKLADQVNAINDMSARTGIASSTLAGLEVAAKMSGQELGDLEGILNKVAADGLDLKETVAQIQAIEDPAERSATAMDLLGEEAGRLVQALGSTNIETFEQFAKDFGTDTGPKAAEAAARWQRAIAGLETVIAGFLTGEGNGLLAFGSAFVENFTIGFIVLQSTITSAVSSVLADLQTLGGALSQLMAGDLAGFGQIMADVGPADVLGNALDAAAKGYEEGAQKAFKYATALRGDLVPAMEETEDETGNATSGLDDFKDATGKVTSGLQDFLDKLDFKQTADDIEDVDQQFRDMAAAMVGATVDTGISAFVGKLDEASEGTNDLIEKMIRLQRLQNTWADMAAGLETVGVMTSYVGSLGSAIGDIYLGMAEKSQKAADAAADANVKAAERHQKAADKAAKKAFAINKAAGIANTIVNTAQAIMNAFATLPTPAAAVAAPIVAATGAAQIATIAATTFESGAVPPSAVSIPDTGGQTGTTAPMVKAASTDRGPGYRGGAVYRHRDLDIVAADGGYPGSAFALAPARTGQRRMRD